MNKQTTHDDLVKATLIWALISVFAVMLTCILDRETIDNSEMEIIRKINQHTDSLFIEYQKQVK